ncbi:MAG: autotransporter-associated beta strand repeat-containing protein, partial [Chitinispirillales bacterium]|nr:autotransporter-associated beta strand repeat-containing protein [Chitinispirillales bacterium]
MSAKINGNGGLRLRRVWLAAWAAVAVCAGGGWAQGDGFNVVHATDGVTGWTKYGSGNSWGVDDGDAIPNGGTSDLISFLINDHQCQNNGTFIVQFRRNISTEGKDQWVSQGGGVVFRFNNTSQYYYLQLKAGGWSSDGTIAIYKNETPTGENVSQTAVYQNTVNIGTGAVYKLQIQLDGASIKVTNMNDSKVVADYTDPEPILSGRVGYAAKRLSWGGNYFIRYISSSWEGKDPPAKLVPANYLAWNSTPVGVDFNPPASGSWLGSFWSRDSSKSAPGSWTSGRSALFAGPSGTYAVNVPAAGATVDTMRFESNTYTVSGPGALTNTGYSGRIYVNAAQATVSARLTGTGGLTKRGAGTLRLGSAAADSTNTYTGATVISAGSVVAVKNGALGTGAVTASAAGTQLQLNGGVTLPNAITIGARNLYSLGSGTGNMLSGGVSLTGTMDTIQVDNALSMSGVVSGGASGITKTGTAQLTLSNDNTYTGVTNVRGGNLQIGSGGATGNLTGTGGINVAAGTGVIFNRSNAFTYDGVISGAGGVTKSGAGTLTLSGANSYTGATAINAGGVTITTAANIGSGPITVNGTLTVNNTANIDLNRQLSGTGTFVKSGAGTLTLPAAASVGVRNVSVGAGVLTANAALAVDSIAVGSGARINGASLGKDGSSKIMVNGGTLAGGTGYNGAVTLTGTSVSPGTIIHDAANLLQIDGPFTMNANSRISAPIRALSSILVTGALTLGGALNITTTPAAPIAEGIYKIINYHGAASGNFAAFTVDGSSPPAAYTFKTEV